jgi:hypothetical protein
MFGVAFKRVTCQVLNKSTVFKLAQGTHPFKIATTAAAYVQATRRVSVSHSSPEGPKLKNGAAISSTMGT